MKKFISFFSIIIVFTTGCKITDDRVINNTSENNFSITIYDSDITDPENDRRCYYIIYIDKIESGRTSTGLESQYKIFENKLSLNRHLIKVEKWILNEKLGRYLKMNNIDQPKPDYIYINIESGKKIKVKLKSSKTGIATYSMLSE